MRVGRNSTRKKSSKFRGEKSIVGILTSIENLSVINLQAHIS
jgi:hypothetical protein